MHNILPNIDLETNYFSHTYSGGQSNDSNYDVAKFNDQYTNIYETNFNETKEYLNQYLSFPVISLGIFIFLEYSSTL